MLALANHPPFPNIVSICTMDNLFSNNKSQMHIFLWMYVWTAFSRAGVQETVATLRNGGEKGNKRKQNQYDIVYSQAFINIYQ